MKKTKVLLILFSLLVGLMTGGWLLWRIENQFIEFSRLTAREELAGELALAQERLIPDHLVGEAIIETIKGIEVLNPASAKLCESRFRKTFGESVSWVIISARGTRISSSGFSQLDSLCFAGCMQEFRTSEEGQFSDAEGLAESRQHWNELFGKSWGPYDSTNRISLDKITYRGVRGFLLMALLYPPQIPNRRFLLLKPQGVPLIPKGSFRGGLAAFVPASLASDDKWVVNRIRNLFGVNETSDKAVSRQGILVEKNTAGFSVSESDFDGSPTREIREQTGFMTGYYRIETGAWHAYLVFKKKLPGLGLGNIRWVMGLSFLLSLTLLIGFALIGRGGEWLGWPLWKKLVFMACLVGVAPTSGLFWSWNTLDRWRTNLSKVDREKLLEERISGYEKPISVMKSNLVTAIQRFLFELQKSPKGSKDARFMSLVDELGLQAVEASKERIGVHLVRSDENQVFSSELAGDPEKNPKTPEKRENQRNTHKLVGLLLEGLRNAFHFGGSGRLAGANETRGEIVIEALEGMLGKAQLYNSIVMLDQIIGFQFWGERMWAFIHLFEHRSARDLFLFNIRRKFIQRNLVVEWTKGTLGPDHRFPEGFPSMVFGNSIDTEFYLSYEPLILFPEVTNAVRRLSRDGGSQKFVLDYQGKTWSALAGRIRGTDLVGIAIEQESQGRRTWTEVFSFFVIGYPFLVVLLAGRLLRSIVFEPLLELKAGVDFIRGGSYDARLPVLTDDEIGELCIAFNHMAQGLQEREYMSRFLSRLTLEAVEKSERPPATRCRATVMFSDIRGFTTLSESRPGEEIVEMLNDYLTRMEEVIETHGGIIDKFIGDAIMAVFLPIHGREDPAERAVRAGLAMRTALSSFNNDRRSAGAFEIQSGIGIATGEVLMGALGGGTRRDFTVTGPTVNRAAQMEKHSKLASQTFVVVCDQTKNQLWVSAEFVRVDVKDRESIKEGAAWEVLR